MTQADGSRTSKVGRRRAHIAGGFVAAMFVALALLIEPQPGAQAGVAPPNDDFSSPIVVEADVSPFGTRNVNYTNTQSTAGATLEAGEPGCFPDDDGATVWYFYASTFRAPMIVDTAGSDYDASILVIRLTGAAPSPPGGALPTTGLQEITCARGAVAFEALAGEYYAIQIAGAGGGTGTLQVRVACDPGCPPPNDDSTSANNLRRLPFSETLDTSYATLEAGEPGPECGAPSHTAWYRIDPMGTSGDATTVTVEASVATVVGVYRQDPSLAPSPPGSLQLINAVCSEAGAAASPLTFVTESDEVYFIQVGSIGEGGDLRVGMTCQDTDCFFGPDIGVDTGGGSGQPVRPPDAGNGGYR